MTVERDPQDFVPVRGGWSFKGFKGKGGGGARQPVESPDSLHSTAYARVQDLLSEGEIVGLVNGLQSVYLNETPLQNADGILNFSGVQVEFRSGTVYQSYIPGFPASESSIGVGVELKFGTPWVRAISNSSLSAVRLTLGVEGLSKADTSNGDVTGYSVEYAVDLQTAGGQWVEVIKTAFTGKTTNKYRRSHRIDLPASRTGWSIRVRRLTPQANSNTVADITVIDSITEIIDGKLRHPMSAIVGLTVDATQFNGVPTRGYHCKGRIIRVPSNYDPVNRVYTGVWNGTFKPAYTNNPAWIYYDMLVNDVYGLGNLIPEAYIDKWSLYQIGAYCDQMVPDGRGGQEPRFTCNLYLQTANEAMRVLMDMSSIFRGMMYWAAGSAVPVADMPRDDVYTYNPSNVIGGVFHYSGSRRKDRMSSALVSWTDMSDMGRQKVVAYQDDEAVRRYGIRQTEVSAFGCTSEAQATRLAKWLLLTSLRETETVTFQVGLDGTIAAPGQLIKVADSLIAGRRIGGRIKSATKTQVTVDLVTQVKYGDDLTVVLPNGKTQTRPVTKAVGKVLTADNTTYTMDTTQITADVISLPGSTMTITVSPGFDDIPLAEAPWSIDTHDLKTQLFNVVKVAELDGLKFEITCVQHEPGKFSAIDYGTKLEDRPVSVVPPMVQPAPASVTVGSYSVIFQGSTTTTGVIEWPAADKAVGYEVEWRRDNSDWVRAGRTQTTRMELPAIYAGVYVARVRAINSIEVPSLWTQSQPTQLNGIIGAPKAVTSLTTTSKVMAIDLAWGFPAGPSIVERTEIWYSKTSNLAQAIKLSDLAYPQNTHSLMGLASGAEFWFWARLVDKNGMPGPWYPTGAGVRGKSSTDSNEILGYLKGQIDETMLGQDLAKEINRIDPIEKNLAQEIRDRQDQGTNLGNQISTETQQRVNADNALGVRVDTVSAATGNNAAAIQSEITARTDADTALGKRIDTVSAANATNAAAIQTEATARANADSALSTRIDTVSATTNQNKADIITETKARTDADTALAASITTLSSTVGGNTAAIQSEATTRANADTALGKRVDTVQASVGDLSASVQTNATAIADSNGKIAAMYTIKTQTTVDGIPYIAGIGVGSENNNGVITTQILLSAQRIVAFNEANNSKTAPFAIVNGQVIMNQAIIGNASIGSAKFADETSSDAWVAGQPVLSINWRTGVQRSVSLTGNIKSEQGTGYWLVTDVNTGVVVLEIDARG